MKASSAESYFFCDRVEQRRDVDGFDGFLPFESALMAFMKSKHGGIMDTIETSGNLDDATEKALTAAVDEFKKTGVY